MSTATSLFKYRAFNKSSIELMVNRELWFADPNTLNDPFECQMYYDRALEVVWSKHDVPESKRQSISNRLAKILSEVGICSFSRTRKNQLMWSHYSDEHKGFCIGFSQSKLKQTSENFGSIDVTYQADLPYKIIIERIKYFENLYPQRYKVKSIASDLLDSVIGTKYTNWKYEKETRLIRPKYGALKFSPKAVVSIAFGLRMTNRDKLTLKKLLEGNEWSHVKWFQAEKAEDKFALEFVPVYM